MSPTAFGAREQENPTLPSSMKAWYGNDTNMFVVSIYFPLKKNAGIEEDTFFRILTDTCAFPREGPTWESWLTGVKGCLFIPRFKKMIKNKHRGSKPWKNWMLNQTTEVRFRVRSWYWGTGESLRLKGKCSFDRGGSGKTKMWERRVTYPRSQGCSHQG